MAKEIERKFLVTDDTFIAQATAKYYIIQGYLSRDSKATVRVRVADDSAYITIKSRTEGFSRDEWEYTVPKADALQMMELCAPRTIEKTRYIVPAENGLKWEVDVFAGRHQGLVIAEIELPDEHTEFARPDFVGDEVTGNPRFYNSWLASAK